MAFAQLIFLHESEINQWDSNESWCTPIVNGRNAQGGAGA